MNKLTTAIGAMAIATPTLADIPDTPECQPLSDLVTAFSERYEQGILSMDISPQIESFYDIAEVTHEKEPTEVQVESAYRTGQELGLKMESMGLQPFQMQYVLENLHRAVADCINRPKA